jgi:hypothetical protein
MLYRSASNTSRNQGIIFIFFVLWAFCSVIHGCGTDGQAPEYSVSQEAGIERSIGPEGGVVEITDPGNSAFGAKIDVPSNALTESTLLSIQSSTNDAAPPLETFPAGTIVSFLPNGTIFNEAVTISLPYNDMDNDGFIDGTVIAEENISAMVFNEQSSQWQNIRVTGLDPEKNILQIQTTHFTDYEAVSYLTEKCESSDTPLQIGSFYFSLYFDFRSLPNIFKSSVSDVGADLYVGNATLIDDYSSVIEEQNFQDMFYQVLDATKWD